MIDPNEYYMMMAEGGEIDGIYTELRAYQTEFGFPVYMVEPTTELLATFEEFEFAENFIQNYFN